VCSGSSSSWGCAACCLVRQHLVAAAAVDRTERALRQQAQQPALLLSLTGQNTQCGSKHSSSRASWLSNRAHGLGGVLFCRAGVHGCQFAGLMRLALGALSSVLLVCIACSHMVCNFSHLWHARTSLLGLLAEHCC
jgi:hypothetical protein